MSKSPTPIIDAWANPVLPWGESVPEVARLFARSKADSSLLSRRRTPAEYVALMDAEGVDRIALSAWYRPNQVVFSNDDVAQFTRAYPERFIGVASVNLYDPVGACKELDHYVRHESFKALRIVPWLWNLPPNDKHYWPLYVKCIELGVPFLTQVGHTGPLCPSEPGRPVPYLDEVALQFPDLVIVAGHIGFPWTEEMIGVALKHENVYIDTSAHLPRYYPPALVQYINTTGRSKVLMGTNFPQLSWGKVLSQCKDIGIREASMSDFLGGNAVRVFQLGSVLDNSDVRSGDSEGHRVKHSKI